MHSYEMKVYDLAQFQAPIALLSPDPTVRAVLTWVGQSLKMKPGERALCATCDAKWSGEHDWSIMVATPFTKATGQAIVSGICPTCAAAADLEEKLVGGLRHGCFGGDLQVLQHGRRWAMTGFSETDKDVDNVVAWAELIEDLLFLVPWDKRAEVLAIAVKNEEADRKELEKHNGLVVVNAGAVEWMNSPGMRHWNAIMRLKSLLVQVFVRNIANNHSPGDAARILYARHPHGTGSGYLDDYLPEDAVV